MGKSKISASSMTSVACQPGDLEAESRPGHEQTAHLARMEPLTKRLGGCTNRLRSHSFTHCARVAG